MTNVTSAVLAKIPSGISLSLSYIIHCIYHITKSIVFSYDLKSFVDSYFTLGTSSSSQTTKPFLFHGHHVHFLPKDAPAVRRT